jgi:hypothetical protein
LAGTVGGGKGGDNVSTVVLLTVSTTLVDTGLCPGLVPLTEIL